MAVPSRLPAETIVGGSASVTMTLKAQMAVLPEASVAVQFTVLVPVGKDAPLGGVHTLRTPGQLSTLRGENTTVAVDCPVLTSIAISFGQVMTGGCVSMTLTVKLLLSEF